MFSTFYLHPQTETERSSTTEGSDVPITIIHKMVAQLASDNNNFLMPVVYFLSWSEVETETNALIGINI